MNRHRAKAQSAGFTLIEVVLVVVIIAILSGIAIPYYAGTLRGMKLRTSARLVTRAALFARGQAILRETTMRIEIDPDTMKIRLGEIPAAAPDSTDGKLDQAVLERLGYIDKPTSPALVQPEFEKKFPDHLAISDFRNDSRETDGLLLQIDFYPNGQCDAFHMELEDDRGTRLKLKNDPITAKVHSELTQ